MAFEPTNAVVSTAVDQGFIPQLWSDEVVAEYKSNLVVASLMRKLNHTGKKGDTIYVPTPDRGAASDKAAATAVTLIAHPTDNRIAVLIDKHKEYSRLIEDFADVQALSSLRRFYVDDAGYAISQATDYDAIAELLSNNLTGTVFDASVGSRLINSGATFTTVSGGNTILEGDGTTVSAATNDATGYAAISDAGIRRAIRNLDVNDVPMANRSWVIHPVVKETLIAIPRFTEQAFVGEVAGGNSIRNGLIGDVYGTSVYVSNQVPGVEASDSEDGVNGYCSVFFHEDAAVHVEQLGMRTQRQYKQEFLADLLTTDCIYGFKTMRPGAVQVMFSENA